MKIQQGLSAQKSEIIENTIKHFKMNFPSYHSEDINDGLILIWQYFVIYNVYAITARNVARHHLIICAHFTLAAIKLHALIQ